ncbi:MAG: hypothetical protein JNM57_00220 [Cyclobacteriaceae bacterium]|nr:hypothetical protein [Cyclobacteriaceae bacterium]
MLRFLSFMVVVVLLTAGDAMAQCAMCRSTLENNYSNGNPGIAAGINTGILYLLVMPYLAVITLGYFWYKSSKNARKGLLNRTA